MHDVLTNEKIAPFGRLTARGGDAVEASLTEILCEIRDLFSGLLEKEEYAALLLIGGYGRGEGGVVAEDGKELPHNNLDLLLFSRSACPEELSERLEPALEPLRQQHDLGFDLGIIPEGNLRTAPCLVMWYDVRFGHKQLLGDEDFSRNLDRFSVDKIPATDVLNLLVNRGTLVTINSLLLDQNDPAKLSEAQRKLLVKHAMKAIIGYGDALLYSRGEYDWSYTEKGERMERADGVSEDFRELYAKAVDFRFSPDYPGQIPSDPLAWTADLRSALEPAHRAFEAHRLGLGGSELRWENYLEQAGRHALAERPASARGLARRIVNVVKGGAIPQGMPVAAKLGLRAAGASGVLPLAFPAAAYELDGAIAEGAASILGATSTSPADLRLAYVRRWAELVDPNFPHVAKKFGITT